MYTTILLKTLNYKTDYGIIKGNEIAVGGFRKLVCTLNHKKTPKTMSTTKMKIRKQKSKPNNERHLY